MCFIGINVFAVNQAARGRVSSCPQQKQQTAHFVHRTSHAYQTDLAAHQSSSHHFVSDAEMMLQMMFENTPPLPLPPPPPPRWPAPAD